MAMRGLVYAALLVAVYYVAARLQAFIQYLVMLRLVRLMQDLLR
jgi:hypothetical protein